MQLNINGKSVAIVAAAAVACSGLGLAVSQAVSSAAPQPAAVPKAGNAGTDTEKGDGAETGRDTGATATEPDHHQQQSTGYGGTDTAACCCNGRSVGCRADILRRHPVRRLR